MTNNRGRGPKNGDGSQPNGNHPEEKASRPKEGDFEEDFTASNLLSPSTPTLKATIPSVYQSDFAPKKAKQYKWTGMTLGEKVRAVFPWRSKEGQQVLREQGRQGPQLNQKAEDYKDPAKVAAAIKQWEEDDETHKQRMLHKKALEEKAQKERDIEAEERRRWMEERNAAGEPNGESGGGSGQPEEEPEFIPPPVPTFDRSDPAYEKKQKQWESWDLQRRVRENFCLRMLTGRSKMMEIWFQQHPEPDKPEREAPEASSKDQSAIVREQSNAEGPATSQQAASTPERSQGPQSGAVADAPKRTTEAAEVHDNSLQATSTPAEKPKGSQSIAGNTKVLPTIPEVPGTAARSHGENDTEDKVSCPSSKLRPKNAPPLDPAQCPVMNGSSAEQRQQLFDLPLALRKGVKFLIHGEQTAAQAQQLQDQAGVFVPAATQTTTPAGPEMAGEHNTAPTTVSADPSAKESSLPQNIVVSPREQSSQRSPKMKERIEAYEGRVASNMNSMSFSSAAPSAGEVRRQSTVPTGVAEAANALQPKQSIPPHSQPSEEQLTAQHLRDKQAFEEEKASLEQERDSLQDMIEGMLASGSTITPNTTGVNLTVELAKLGKLLNDTKKDYNTKYPTTEVEDWNGDVNSPKDRQQLLLLWTAFVEDVLKNKKRLRKSIQADLTQFAEDRRHAGSIFNEIKAKHERSGALITANDWRDGLSLAKVMQRFSNDLGDPVGTMLKRQVSDEYQQLGDEYNRARLDYNDTLPNTTAPVWTADRDITSCLKELFKDFVAHKKGCNISLHDDWYEKIVEQDREIETQKARVQEVRAALQHSHTATERLEEERDKLLAGKSAWSRCTVDEHTQLTDELKDARKQMKRLENHNRTLEETLTAATNTVRRFSASNPQPPDFRKPSPWNAEEQSELTAAQSQFNILRDEYNNVLAKNDWYKRLLAELFQHFGPYSHELASVLHEAIMLSPVATMPQQQPWGEEEGGGEQGGQEATEKQESWGPNRYRSSVEEEEEEL